MDIAELTQHPEHLDRDTLYELRSLLALYPYYQTVRLLLLQNLYLLHDPTFDEELRRAAIYITDRRVLFQMIEAVHYRHPSHQSTQNNQSSPSNQDDQGNRTLSLINNFLDSIPKEDETDDEKKNHRKPTPADAAVDYVAYLLQCEADEQDTKQQAPKMRGQSLIDNFLEQEQGRILLSDIPLDTPEEDVPNDENDDDEEEEYFTETLARIYIKQGRYQKAHDIIARLSLKYPQKNTYFADQMRFLEKLIINNKNKN